MACRFCPLLSTYLVRLIFSHAAATSAVPTLRVICLDDLLRIGMSCESTLDGTLKGGVVDYRPCLPPLQLPYPSSPKRLGGGIVMGIVGGGAKVR